MTNSYGGTAGPNKQTLIEEGTSLKGTLSSTCPIMVRGRIEGELETPALSVSPSGAVHGKVKVGDLRSEGELAGEFDADTVSLSGSIKDNTVIRAKTLEVKLQSEGKMQVMFGECELNVGDLPGDKDGARNNKKKGKKDDGDVPGGEGGEGG
jgi:cytoskeletal protein CcmA (bactofilin family)